MDDLMLNIFGIISMADNYEERKVANTEEEVFTLDTAAVTDRSWKYETAVKHKRFNNNQWVILGGCDTKEKAIAMHDKWLALLRQELPVLVDYYDHSIYFDDTL